MLDIDGARGEGGGQVARFALALAAATRRDVRVRNIRANRAPAGLKAGHTAAARAIAEISDAEVTGAELGSTEITLRPGTVTGGTYEFTIETAGPVTLLLQAVMPAIVASRQEFSLTLRGGTNVRWAPQWDDTVHVHIPLLRRLGIEVGTTLARRGYFPQGGGEVQVDVATPALHKVDLTEPGALQGFHAVVSSHGLPRHVMERAIIALEEGLRDLGPVRIEQDFHRGPGTGMAVAVRAECARTTLGSDAVGRKGVRVEDVVEEAIRPLRQDLAAGAGLDTHQADQLPVFMALAGGGTFTTRQVSDHAQTVLDLLPEFLPVRVETTRMERLTRVTISQT